MEQLTVGAKAPDFDLKTLEGNDLRLSNALRDGPVVLAFYKASCPTCQLTFPYLQQIHAARAENPGARIVGVSQDDAAETHEFAERFGLGFDIAIDPHPYDVSSAYGVEFVPAIFLVKTDGTIQLSDFGFSKPALEEIAGSLKLFSADDGLPARRPG